MICFDTNVLIWSVQASGPPAMADLRIRARRYLEHLDRERTTVLVPAPALSEYLAWFHPQDHATQMRVFEKGFRMGPFDTQAAALAARILHQREALRQVRDQHQITRQLVRVDVIIVAIAAAQGVTAIVSHDAHIRALVQLGGFPIQVHEIPEMPQQTTLF